MKTTNFTGINDLLAVEKEIMNTYRVANMVIVAGVIIGCAAISFVSFLIVTL